MTKLSFQIDIKGVAAIPRSQLRNAFRDGIRAAGHFWRENYLPNHFKANAVQKYGYTARDRKYRRRKRAGVAIEMFGGESVASIREDKPLVWSGRSRERALASRKVDAVARSADNVHAIVRINAPALNLRPKGGKINMGEEVKRVLPLELVMMESEYVQESQAALERMGSTKRISKVVRA